MTDDVTDRAIESIVKQFRGGERALAGRRASELLYGGSHKLNEDFLDRLKEAAPGIDTYITAPETPPPPVGDHGGNPLAPAALTQASDGITSNASTDQAKAEQNEIDERLAKGREKTEEANDAADEGNKSVGSTQLNPDSSSSDDQPEEAEKAKKSGRAKKSDA